MGDTALSTVGPVTINITTLTSNYPSTTDIYIPNEFSLPKMIENIFLPCIVTTLFIGLVANVLAVFITVKCARENKEHRLTIPGILLRALLATDISATTFFLIRGCFWFIYRKTWIHCDLNMASNLIFSWTSGLVIMLMCCDRGLALGAPFFYHAHATQGKTYLTLVVSVLVAAILGLLPVMGFGAYKMYIQGEYYCIAPGDLQAKATDFDFGFNVMFFTLGLGVLVVTYAANSVVLHQILKLRKRHVVVVDSEMLRANSSMNGEAHLRGCERLGEAPSKTICSNDHTIPDSATPERTPGVNARIDTTPGNVSAADSKIETPGTSWQRASRVKSLLPRNSEKGRKEMRFGATIIIFSMVFTLSWLPFYIQRLQKAISGSSSHTALAIVIYLLTLNHLIDPFVYVLMKPQYHKKLVQLGRKWRTMICRRCQGENASPKGVQDVRSVSGAFDRNRRHSLGTPVTSCTMTTRLWQDATQQKMQLSAAPLIQVTSASPSLVSENSQQDQTDIMSDVSGCSHL